MRLQLATLILNIKLSYLWAYSLFKEDFRKAEILFNFYFAAISKFIYSTKRVSSMPV